MAAEEDEVHARRGRPITLDGKIGDVVSSLGGVLAQRSHDLVEWAFRAIMDYSRVNGMFVSFWISKEKDKKGTMN